MKIKSIAVYCASAKGFDSVYYEQASLLGNKIGERNNILVYGGASVGLMGAVADGALSKGGKVIGVIPAFLKKKELEHKTITEHIIVETMHQRKAKMEELADAFIALPGGFGTMEEFFEMLTWGQLALHKKPIGLLNVKGFYNPLLVFIDGMIEKGFVKEEYKSLLVIEDNIDLLFQRMDDYIPTLNDKWFEPR